MCSRRKRAVNIIPRLSLQLFHSWHLLFGDLSHDVFLPCRYSENDRALGGTDDGGVNLMLFLDQS